MRFPDPPAVEADAHVRKLLANPGDPGLEGYPPRLVPRADAALARGRGHRPLIILFYDDAMRVSDLQAAAFLPVLTKYQDRVDIVPIDVSKSKSWSDAERWVVRKYYMAEIPSTVVLGPSRSPLLLRYQRITKATLETVLEQATR